MTATAAPRRDRATYAGIGGVALAAIVLSASSLSGLGELVGITGHLAGFRLAWLLPIAVDAYAVTATRVWLRTGIAERTRIYARRNSIGAIGLSVAGNATFHGLSAAGVTSLTDRGAGWLLVVAVSAVPPVMLGLVGHLHALISAEHDTTTDTAPTAATPTAAPAVPARDATPALPAPSRPAMTGRSRSTGTATTRTTTADSGTASTGSGSPTRTSKGDAEAAMRTHWATERAAGRTPTGAELDRIAGTRDYGRKVRRTLLAETEPAGLHTAPETSHPTTPDADAADAA